VHQCTILRLRQTFYHHHLKSFTSTQDMFFQLKWHTVIAATAADWCPDAHSHVPDHMYIAITII